MRTITIVVDDAGRTEVKINVDEKTQQFFTKREFDRALCAAKLQYRLQKREYRKKQIIERAKVTIGETNESTDGTRSRPEQRQETSSERTREDAGRGTSSLQDALRAKSERNRRAKAGETS